MNARILPRAALFLLVAASTLHAMGSPDSEIDRISDIHPVIAHAQGDVKVRKDGGEGWEEASAGMLLLSGDEIMTGKDSKAEIRFASGSVRIYENSVMIIPSIGPDRQRKDIRNIFIDDGAGRFRINPRGTREGFEFRTKTVQGSVRGTDFTVKVKGSYTVVVVSQGIVELSDSEGGSENTVVVEKGEAVRLDKDTKFDEINVQSVKETRDPVIKETLDMEIMEINLAPDNSERPKSSVIEDGSLDSREEDGNNSTGK